MSPIGYVTGAKWGAIGRDRLLAPTGSPEKINDAWPPTLSTARILSYLAAGLRPISIFFAALSRSLYLAAAPTLSDFQCVDWPGVMKQVLSRDLPATLADKASCDAWTNGPFRSASQAVVRILKK